MTLAKLNAVDPHQAADQHEDALGAAYEQVLCAAGRKAASRFKRLSPLSTTAAADPKQPAWTPPNIDELVDLRLIETQTAEKTQPIHRKALAAVLGAYEVGEPSFDVLNPAALSLLGQLGGRSGDVAKSVRDELSRIIADAYQQGFSVAKTAEQITQTSDQFSVAQSRMLARTDLNGLANGGSVMAAQAAGVGYKTWLATEDEATRPDHSEADGQTVPIDQPFDVGGESADFPGDPGLSDEQACNCRCSVTYSDNAGDAGLQASVPGATTGGKMDTEAQITIPLTLSVGQAFNQGGGFTVTEINSDEKPEWYFAASGSTDLPLSDRDTPWDAGAARKSLQPGDFAKAHFWKDPDGPADQIGSYKLPFAQRVNGTLTAIWRGVTAGAARLDQTEGIDKPAVQAKMAAYYKKAATQYSDPKIETPWSMTEPEKHPYMAAADGSCMECGAGASAPQHQDAMLAAAGQQWRAVLCVEGQPTEDGRLLAPGSITWRQLPLTLMCQTETAPGHDGAEVCGRIDRIWRDGSNIMGEGVFDSGAYGLETARLVGEQVLRGVSVDLAVLEYEIREAPDGDDSAMDSGDGLDVPLLDDGDQLFVVTDGVIGAATICPFQAIAAATIEVLTSAGPLKFRITREFATEADEALTAAAAGLAPLEPPDEWFAAPLLDGPTPITLTEDGRLFGHAALWNTCHVGVPGSCTTAPRSRSQYRYFHLGAVRTAGGDEVAVGQVTLGTGHAGLRLSSEQTLEHYDNTGTAGADVRVGEDAHGIWVAGAARPDLSAERARTLRGAKLSGDWRNIDGQLELVGLLAVNVPGFPVPRPQARVASGGMEPERMALVAAGLPEPVTPSEHRVRVLAARARGGIQGLAELARA